MKNKYNFKISYIIILITILNIYLNRDIESEYSCFTYLFMSTIQILILKLFYTYSNNLFIILYFLFLICLLYSTYNKFKKINDKKKNKK